MQESLVSKKQSVVSAWILASRPKTLTASFVPVATATVLAWKETLNFSLSVLLCSLVGTFLIQIGTNLINDALDFKKGADKNTRLGEDRAVQKGLLSFGAVYKGGLACFFLAGLAAFPLIIKGKAVIAGLFALSVLSGYLYTGGPKPLAYYGLGDLFVLIFFGVAATGAVFYLQAGFIDLNAVFAGIQIGLLATVMIAINNLRDHAEDRKALKMTLAARFGQIFSKIEITFLAFIPFLLGFWWVWQGYFFVFAFPVITLPLAASIVRNIWTTEPSKSYNRFLAKSALLHLSFGILMALGMMFS